MGRKIKYAVLVAAGISFFVLVQMNTKEQVNWEMSFSREDTIPYGTFVLHDLLPVLFGSGKVEAIHEPAYNVLKSRKSGGRRNYIFINRVFSPDDLDCRELLGFVSAGNDVFVAAQFFRGTFAKELEIETGMSYGPFDESGLYFSDRPFFEHPAFAFGRNAATFHLEKYRRKGSRVLGMNTKRKAAFVRIKHGKGFFYISSTPLVFTNYHLLHDRNYNYAFRALSHLGKRRTFWDEYYKVGRMEARTPLRYILNRESLRWAYFVAVSGFVLFFLFESRRRQRAIPVIEPPVNATLEFVRTIGRLYFQYGDHRNLAEKRISFLFEYIRSVLLIDPGRHESFLFARLSEKTGMPEGEVREVFEEIGRVQAAEKISEKELVRLNGLIEKFYGKVQGRKV